MTEQDRNEYKKSGLNYWRFDNVDTFLRKVFTHLKPKSEAMTEQQKREQFLKTIEDFGRTRPK